MFIYYIIFFFGYIGEVIVYRGFVLWKNRDGKEEIFGGKRGLWITDLEIWIISF